MLAEEIVASQEGICCVELVIDLKYVGETIQSQTANYLHSCLLFLEIKF